MMNTMFCFLPDDDGVKTDDEHLRENRGTQEIPRFLGSAERAEPPKGWKAENKNLFCKFYVFCVSALWGFSALGRTGFPGNSIDRFTQHHVESMSMDGMVSWDVLVAYEGYL